MWNTISDYMNSFLGAFFLFLSIIFIPEIRRSKKYWISISVLIIILLFLGIDKTNRDKRDKRVATIQKQNDDKKIDTLRSDVNQLGKIKSDYDEFAAKLKSEYSIIKDSNNQPKKVVYNTNIDKARDVHIGPEYK